MIHTKIKYRELNYKDDIFQITQIEKLLFDDPFLRGQLYFYHRMYDTSASYIAIIDNELVGYIFVIQEEKQNHIYTIGVQPKFQNKGIGRNLLQLVKMKSRDRCLPIVLEVSEHNNIALDLYKSEGFHIISREEQYYRDHSAAIHMKWTP